MVIYNLDDARAAYPYYQITATVDSVVVTEPFIHNPAYDITFDCLDNSITGQPEGGVIVFVLSCGGDDIPDASTKLTLELSLSGLPVEGVIINDAQLFINLTISEVELFLERLKTNWVTWSKIGSLDFTIDKSNESGEMPVDWDGFIHNIKILGNNIIVYGDGGISALKPVGVSFGLQPISKIGLKGRNTICGNKYIHYFINKANELCVMTGDKIQKLGYQQYMSGLSSDTVMLLDDLSDALYICDESKGYIYRNGCLAEGIAGITGLQQKNGIMIVSAPSELKTPLLEICTGVFDMGTRARKSIHSIGVSCSSPDIEVCVYYRDTPSDDFASTGWHQVDSRGVVYINAYGVEFMFAIRSRWSYKYIEIYDINIQGEINGH